MSSLQTSLWELNLVYLKIVCKASFLIIALQLECVEIY